MSSGGYGVGLRGGGTKEVTTAQVSLWELGSCWRVLDRGLTISRDARMERKLKSTGRLGTSLPPAMPALRRDGISSLLSIPDHPLVEVNGYWKEAEKEFA